MVTLSVSVTIYNNYAWRYSLGKPAAALAALIPNLLADHLSQAQFSAFLWMFVKPAEPED
jgi:hypothetical protein